MTSVPQYHTFMWPTVVALRQLGGSGTISEIVAQVAEDGSYSEEQQSLLHKDGPGTEIAYRIAWARTYLKGMGLATNTRRGVWALAEEGRRVTEKEIAPLRKIYLASMKDARKGHQATPPELSEEEQPWQDQLLERLLELHPDAFERLCRRILREAGFIRTQVTGGSGDGGIDGVGTYRVSLVSFQVFFQAKRWRKSVGSKEVRDFRGAMTGRGEKGLLITTSTFTAEAKAEASRDGAPPVDLVDGAMLCELLADHGIGVTVSERIVRDVVVDEAALRAI